MAREAWPGGWGLGGQVPGPGSDPEGWEGQAWEGWVPGLRDPGGLGPGPGGPGVRAGWPGRSRRDRLPVAKSRKSRKSRFSHFHACFSLLKWPFFEKHVFWRVFFTFPAIRTGKMGSGPGFGPKSGPRPHFRGVWARIWPNLGGLGGSGGVWRPDPGSGAGPGGLGGWGLGPGPAGPGGCRAGWPGRSGGLGSGSEGPGTRTPEGPGRTRSEGPGLGPQEALGPQIWPNLGSLRGPSSSINPVGGGFIALLGPE